MQFNVVMLGSDDSAIRKESYFRKVLLHLREYWKSILLLVPSKEGKKGFYKVTDGVWYYYFPSFFHLLLFALSRHKIKAKLIITMDPFLYGLVGMLLKHKKLKLVMELHSQNLFNKKWLQYRRRNLFYHILARLILPRADKIRSVYYDKKIFSLYKDKIELVPSNYTDTKLFVPNINEKEKEYDVIYVGRFHPEKNIEYLYNIIKQLNEKKYRCLIIGRGSLKYKIMLLSAGCEMIEWVPQDVLAEYYKKSKVLISTSYNEGGPRTVYEALACGCLVAITPTGLARLTIEKHPCCGEIISGENLKEDVQKIQQLIKEYPKRAKKCAHNIRKELNYKKQIKRYGEFIKSLL